MKYNLRSLMTFSIRDLFWFTVVVALAVDMPYVTADTVAAGPVTARHAGCHGWRA